MQGYIQNIVSQVVDRVIEFNTPGKMITKFETKSNRVKGLCFHPTRPWVLASLHSGIIQLWDYRIRTLLDRFDEHDGPVRGVSFHITQPLFCSGGDDYKIKVWNYKQRRCLFTLMGHLDYIRTVQFHHENPWILSCSDDQTIRIWNWQSRSCVSVLTGHNHYVMCAQFHPKEDLVVSASLDQTVRVWDISGLRKKSISARPTNDSDGLRLQNDLFGSTDAVVKYVLEGHDRGVNWATFHPTSPLIISGADDRQVKLWRMNDSKAWEVDTFRGHFSNVSCVLFHPRQDLILSNSEDKTIRVWDMSKRTGIQTFRREHDRFWVLSAHPELNLFAAGHDSGMLVFKLERERPAFASNEDSILFIKDRYLRSFEYASQRDNPLMGIRRSSSGLGNKIRTMSYNPQDRAVLMISDSEGGFYELYLIPRTGNTDNVESKRGLGTSAVFVGRKRFAVLDKTNQIILKSLSNEEVKRFSVPGVNAIFEAPVGQLLLRQDDKISLFDISQRKTIAELMSSRIKSAVWTPQTLKNPFVALLGKDVLIIANRKLEQVAMIHETIQIKSGAWDDEGVFIYSTLNHIKYCLPNGDHGIVRTLETPVYITSVIKSKIYCLDRETRNRIIYIDPTEYRFKMALHKKKYDVILKMVQESNLIGQSIISYLQKKGFPEIALYFVQDPKTKFGLALECGNIDIALETAKILEDKECWEQLAVVALEQGDIQTVELAYRQTLNFEKLSFLYLITGSSNKLVKMAKLAERRQDIMSRFHNSLFIGDISARVQILEEVGQLPLAYITATIHGLEEQQESLALKLEKQGLEIPSVPMKSILLQPPIPVQKPKQKESEGWPLLNVSTQNLFGIDFTSKASTKTAKQFNLAGDEDIEVTGDWDDDALDAPDAENMDDNWGETDEVIGGEDGEEGGWEEDALEGLEDTDISSVNIKDEFWIPPQPALPTSQIWVRNSELPVDHIAAGSFETAMLLLNQQAGIIDFEPLKSLFLNIYTSTRLSIPATTSVPPLQYALQRNILDLEPSPNARLKGLPLLPVNLENLTEKLKQAYKSTTLGKFGDALSSFLYILHGITLLVVESKHEENEVKELLEICKDYILGLNIELKRKELVAAKENPILQTELAAYFTHSNLQVSHLLLALRSAMNCCYRLKNYSTASTFAKRLLELGPKPDLATQARKVIKFAESNNTDEQELNYDPKNPFVVCSSSLTPIYAGTESVNCSFCGAPSLPKFAGRVCSVCKIGEIGKKCSGLQWLKSGKVTLKYAKK